MGNEGFEFETRGPLSFCAGAFFGTSEENSIIVALNHAKSHWLVTRKIKWNPDVHPDTATSELVKHYAAHRQLDPYLQEAHAGYSVRLDHEDAELNKWFDYALKDSRGQPHTSKLIEQSVNYGITASPAI